jgi:hypothetical protein
MEEGHVMIHVRFAPDGSVTEISERPADRSAQEWFNALSLKFGPQYQALSGGRGVFRLGRADIDAMKSASLQ